MRKPLKSTIHAVRDGFKSSGIRMPPDEVISEIALSQDQYIEDWKASLILMLGNSVSEKAVTKVLSSRGVGAAAASASVWKARDNAKKPVRIKVRDQDSRK